MWRVEGFRGSEDAVPERRRIRLRRLLRALERVVQELLHAGGDLVLLLVGEVGVLAEPAADALDRVVLGPALEHVLRDVEGVVVDRVALHAEGQALEQCRAAALPRLLDRAPGLAVDGT